MRITNWVLAATQSSSGSNDRLLFSDVESQDVKRQQEPKFDFLSSCQRGVFVRPNV